MASATGFAPFRRIFRSAAYRLAFAYTAVCAVAVTTLGIAVTFAAHAAFLRLQDEDLAKEATKLTKEYAEGGRADLLDAITKREHSPSNDLRYALLVDGRTIAGNIRVAPQPTGSHDCEIADRGRSIHEARCLVTQLPDGSLVLVAVSSAGLERLDTVIVSLFGTALVVLLALGVAGATLLGRHLKRRLDRISSTAEAIAAGDLSRRLIATTGSMDEFDRVDASLNAMLDRIATLLDDLRQVSSDVAHDLRTPLARLRSEIEAGLAGPRELARFEDALHRALAQSDALLSLFAAILSLAEVEDAAHRGAIVPLDLASLVQAVCEMHAPAIEDSGRAVGFHAGPEPVVIHGEAALIRQAISNLLDNCLVHTPPGTSIRVAVEADAGEARIIVEDDGPGIAAADRTRVLKRFVRLDRSRSTPGHGLGLSFVASVMQLHLGRVALLDAAGGLRVVLTFDHAGEARLSKACLAR